MRIRVTPNFTKEDYKQAVQDMIDYIVEGDIYIANMTQHLTVEVLVHLTMFSAHFAETILLRLAAI